MKRTTRPPKTEAHLVQRVLDHLRSIEGAWARKVHGSRFQDAGEPDIDACVDGRAVKIELKMPGQEPTPVQYGSMRRWESSGALAGWATSLSEVDDLLSHVSDRRWINPQLCRHSMYVHPEETPCPRCGDDLEWR